LWKAGRGDKIEWDVSLKRISDDIEHPIESFGEKVLYNTDEVQSGSDWLRKSSNWVGRVQEMPRLKSALRVQEELPVDEPPQSMVGYLTNKMNNVYENAQSVYITSAPGGRKGAAGVYVIPANFSKCCALFIARRAITGKHANWITDKDEYQAPNEQHPDYEQWNTDAIVYSLFNTASNQSSLRDVEYKDKTWQILNEWFWLPRQMMIELAEKHDNDDVYQDARTDTDRFVFKALQGLILSPDAQVVLDLATSLVNKTFEYRELACDAHPEWHINTWDASWYQIKLLLKAYMPDALKSFREVYKAFGDRMREGVYDFGFLRR